MTKVRVIGGGLAGSEAALKLANNGFQVELWDIKPHAFTPAHHSTDFSELVCSNSLKSNVSYSAAWLLKAEMRRMGSALLPVADQTSVGTESALSVDRKAFSSLVTKNIREHEDISVVEREYTELDDSVPTIICTGPLSTSPLVKAIEEQVGEGLFFFDAAAPIVDATTIDMTKVFEGARYGKGDDYLNCPLTKQEYYAFVDALTSAEGVKLKDFEGEEVFEGCMPVEVMARRGVDTLRFGPCKPVGLEQECFACVQLRAENVHKTAYNIVGFQTNLKIPVQKRVFSMIPALRNAEYFRYGVMHRNTYLCAPTMLDKTLRLKGFENVYVAGQLSGVEGYTESMASGLVAATYLIERTKKGSVTPIPRTSMIGALMSQLTIPVGNFQPVNANFGIIPPLPQRIKDKAMKAKAICDRAICDLDKYLQSL